MSSAGYIPNAERVSPLAVSRMSSLEIRGTDSKIGGEQSPKKSSQRTAQLLHQI